MNKLNLEITGRAFTDIEQITDYVALDNKNAANKLAKLFQKTFESLCQHPNNKAVLRRLLALLPQVNPRLRCLIRHSKGSLTFLIASLSRTFYLFRCQILCFKKKVSNYLQNNQQPNIKDSKSFNNLSGLMHNTIVLIQCVEECGNRV